MDAIDVIPDAPPQATNADDDAFALTIDGVRRAFSSVNEAIRFQVARSPDREAFVFLRDGETPDGCLTFAQIDARARQIAAALSAHVAAGARALLVFQNGLEFIGAFVGCLYAGVVPVPVYPPLARREH